MDFDGYVVIRNGAAQKTHRTLTEAINHASKLDGRVRVEGWKQEKGPYGSGPVLWSRE